MIGNALFFMGLSVCAALVWRAIAGSWWRAYPIVFAYFLTLLLDEAVEWLVYSYAPRYHAAFYWGMEALFIVFGFGLIWQVYAAIPQEYPGAGRVIKLIAQRIAAFGPLFLIAAALLAATGTVTLDVLERNFRLLHAVLILVVYGLTLYFGIPLSQNLRALLQGYGLYTVVFITKFSLWPLNYKGLWAYVMPAAFLVSLTIWLAGLWDYKDPAKDLWVSEVPGASTQTRLNQLKEQLHTNFLGQ